MAAKKDKSGAAKTKTAAAPLHGSYKDMVKDAILKLKERNGSSRAKIKQYVLANNKGVEQGPAFDNQLNKAIKSGVDKGEFAQPKGPSGTVKLAKKEPAAAKPSTTKKPAAAKKPKSDAPKKAKAPKKAATGATKTKAAPKKTSTKAAKPAAKPKSAANTGVKRKSKAAGPAPAVVDEKKVLGKTKSGRVTKTKAKAASKPAAKKAAAPKKKAAATPKKDKTPKKSTTPAAAA